MPSNRHGYHEEESLMLTLPQPLQRLLKSVLPVTVLVLASASLYAQVTLSVSLRGAAEVPPVKTAATGSGQITVQADGAVSGSIRTEGFEPTMAHIHEAPVGENGPAIVTLKKTGGGNFVVPPDTWLSETEYASYLAGYLYVNVHSAEHPGGEIRGQLQRVATAALPLQFPLAPRVPH